MPVWIAPPRSAHAGQSRAEEDDPASSADEVFHALLEVVPGGIVTLSLPAPLSAGEGAALARDLLAATLAVRDGLAPDGLGLDPHGRPNERPATARARPRATAGAQEAHGVASGRRPGALPPGLLHRARAYRRVLALVPASYGDDEWRDAAMRLGVDPRRVDLAFRIVPRYPDSAGLRRAVAALALTRDHARHNPTAVPAAGEIGADAEAGESGPLAACFALGEKFLAFARSKGPDLFAQLVVAVLGNVISASVAQAPKPPPPPAPQECVAIMYGTDLRTGTRGYFCVTATAPTFQKTPAPPPPAPPARAPLGPPPRPERPRHIEPAPGPTPPRSA